MLPNVTRGHNFGRLAEYLTEEDLEKRVFGPLADYLVRPKDGNSERVGFIELVNFLPGEAYTPKEAAHVMALTAANAAQLKKAAGVAPTGKKATSAPVWHCSLSWKPGEEVDKEEMMKAADSALRWVGLSLKKGYQTIIVQHVDTEHPHIHLQVNLVHPVTGKQANPWCDYERLQVWAHRYDRSRGNEDFCPYRTWKYDGHEPEKKPARTPFTKKRAQRLAEKAARDFGWARNEKAAKAATALTEAAAIRAAQSEKANAISAQNQQEFEARKIAKEALWQNYQAKRAEIKARYDAQIHDFYLHRKYKETRGRKPKGPTHLRQSPEWRGLNRRLRTEKAEFHKRVMAPLEKGHRAWLFNQAANDNKIDQRAKVARAAVENAVNRRDRAAPLRMSMNVEIAALSLAYKFQSQQLKVQEAVEKLAARARWRELSKDRVDTWAKFREKHGLQEKHYDRPDAPQRDLKGRSGINRLSSHFDRATNEPENADELRWSEKTAEFRDNVEDVAARFDEMDAKRKADLEREDSDVSGRMDDSETLEQRFNRLDAEREEQLKQDKGWKLRGKDRAPRNRGGGGREHG